jgi:hypothetical protein
MEFWIPKGASRFHFGGGARFIHGGAMPQELVVPVITVRHVRGLSAQETKTRPVAVQVLGGSHRITTGRHRFQLIQMEPVCERVKAVSLKGAVYEADGPVTNIETVTFDSSRISASIRPHRCGVQGARGAVMTADGRQVSGTETPGRVFCGPAELLARLLDGRGAARRTTPERYGNLSDAAVSRLVLLCYYASQAGGEGRYPTFRVYVTPDNNLPPGVSDPWQLAASSIGTRGGGGRCRSSSASPCRTVRGTYHRCPLRRLITTLPGRGTQRWPIVLPPGTVK